MHVFSVGLIVLGAILALFGGLWLLVAAFRQSILWGLAYLLCSPVGPLAFIIRHWQVAARPFGLNLLGALAVFCGVLSMPPELHERLQTRELRQHFEAGRLEKLAASLSRPTSGPRVAPRETLYRWTDESGTENYSNDFYSVPEQHRAQAQTTLGGALTVAESEPLPPSHERPQQARRDAPVRLLLFTATWCPACKQLDRSGTIEKFAAAHPGVEVERVDVDRESRRASRYRIRSIPTVVLTDSSGKELSRPRSAGSEAELKRALATARQR